VHNFIICIWLKIIFCKDEAAHCYWCKNIFFCLLLFRRVFFPPEITAVKAFSTNFFRSWVKTEMLLFFRGLIDYDCCRKWIPFLIRNVSPFLFRGIFRFSV
jgi:hypothetical protein